MDFQIFIELLKLLGDINYGKAIYEFMLSLWRNDFFRIYLTSKLINKGFSTYRLHKDFKPKNISKVSVPPELKRKYTNIEISQVTSDELRQATLEFAALMVERFPSTALTNFYNNINEVKIKKNKGIIILSAAGGFSTMSNQIVVTELSTIYHELFHMASTYYDQKSKKIYGGFLQVSLDFRNEPFSIGVGIDEGYTQLLAMRYFGKKHKVAADSYEFEVNVVDKLEKIIGQQKMETLYLNANLSGLIDELKKYTREDKISNFINSVDLINRHYYDSFILKNEKMEKSVVNIFGFLLETYLVKLKQQLDKGIINSSEFIQQATQFVQSLGTSVTIGRHNYEFLTTDNLLKIQTRIMQNSQVADKRDGNNSFKK